MLPVIELLSPLFDSNQLIGALPPFQSGCQSVDGCDVSVVHRHILQIKHIVNIICIYLLHCIL